MIRTRCFIVFHPKVYVIAQTYYFRRIPEIASYLNLQIIHPYRDIVIENLESSGRAQSTYIAAYNDIRTKV